MMAILYRLMVVKFLEGSTWLREIRRQNQQNVIIYFPIYYESTGNVPNIVLAAGYVVVKKLFFFASMQ